MLNQKGGVGKTTSSVNVAAALARWGSRVLLVDLDPQSHATMHVGIDPSGDHANAYSLLVEGVSAAEIAQDISDKLTVIPSHVDLVGAEVELNQRHERELVLRRAIAPLREAFDFMIIDCPPSLGALTINSLVAVQEVIIPLQPHFLALQGLGRLLETVSVVRDALNASLRISGVILCMFEKGTRLAAEVENDVREFIGSAGPDDAWFGARVFETVIRRNIKLAECPSFGKTIFEYEPSSNGAQDYEALARELLEMRIVQQAERPAAEVAPPDAAPAAEPADTSVIEEASSS